MVYSTSFSGLRFMLIDKVRPARHPSGKAAHFAALGLLLGLAACLPDAARAPKAPELPPAAPDLAMRPIGEVGADVTLTARQLFDQEVLPAIASSCAVC